MNSYEQELESSLQEAIEHANQAKKDSPDINQEVDIELADDISGRVQSLLGVEGLAEKTREIEDDYEREDLAFKIAEMIADGEIGDYETKEEKIESATRVAVALLTEGVVAAPVEGIDSVTIDDEGFVRAKYNGPIRSAGGTAQALSVFVADYVRQLLDVPEYEATEDEVERYIEELKLYDEDVGLQYMPKRKEIETIMENMPLMVDGNPGGSDVEVEGYRDLPRIDGNLLRGGMCLVMGEGVAQKAPKLQKFRDEVGLEGWGWLDKIVSGSKDDEDEEEDEENEELERRKTPKPNWKEEFKKKDKYLQDITAGRPVFSDPMEKGGFRLKYGRSRNNGLAAGGINPATMIILGEFLANGTQIKTERPAKALGATAVTSIDGPTVELENGDYIQINDIETAEEHKDNIKEITDVGELLVPYGEFLENNHKLAPSPYVEEWWEQEAETQIDADKKTYEELRQISKQNNAPLHPSITPAWTEINTEQLEKLSKQIHQGKITTYTKETLKNLLIEYTTEEGKIHIKDQRIEKLLKDSIPQEINHDKEVLEQVNQNYDIEMRQQVTLRIGARMGRNEQAKKREMEPPVKVLYPIGNLGGDERNIEKAVQNYQDKEKDKIKKVKLNHRKCPNCQTTTYKPKCPNCKQRTTQIKNCTNCQYQTQDPQKQECPKCNRQLKGYKQKLPNIKKDLEQALQNTNEDRLEIPKIKGIKGLLSKNKPPENLQKGIIRAKHGVEIYSDTTCRYDIMDLPLTSFKPKEINLSIEKAHELGYTHDKNGNKLTDPEQIVEIKPQDVIISKEAGNYALDIANYIDELLEKYYNHKPYYNAQTRQDLIGEMIIGLAPHTSAGVVSRIIGYTDARAKFASPFYHAGKRRNCFHPDTTLNYRINGKWKESTIEELVEQYMTEEADDSYSTGEKVQSIDEHPDIEEIKVPSMNDKEQRTIEEVSHLSKHPAPEEMVKIEFNDGTELRVTPEHKIPVRTQEGIEEKLALSIEEGDKCFDYNEEILEKVKGFKQFDLIEEILEKEKLLEDKYEKTLRDIMIRGMKKEEIYDLFIDELEPKWEGKFYKMKSTCEYLDITKKQLDNHLRQESIPLSWLYKIYEEDKERIIEKLPKDVEVGVRRDNVNGFRQVELDEELACLLGYYTAEGFTRFNQEDRRSDNKTGVRQVDFAATELEAREFIEETLRKKFNIENIYKGDKRLTASGFILTFFFNEIVSSGNSASEKRVPEIIKESNERIKKSYLSGYISGDGYMSNGSIRMVTVSEQLRDDVIDLADTLGYKTTCRSVDPIPLKEKFPDYYDESEDKMSKRTYKIRLSNNSSALFVQDYGIHLERKEETERRREIKHVEKVSIVGSSVDATYDLTITETHKLEANITLSNNCDGDQDSIMLLMDGLLNFSGDVLPDKRGGRMDEPLVISTVLNTAGVDDEAYNVDSHEFYPLSFYEGSMVCAGPKEVDMCVADEFKEEGMGFDHNYETDDIGCGVFTSRYALIDGMDGKVREQMELCDLIRAVDSKRVAELVVGEHFMSDTVGNLSSYTRQEFQCSSCYEKYQVPPLDGRCARWDCGGSIRQTLYEGSVRKYLDIMRRLAEDYDMSDYMLQKIGFVEDRVDGVFEGGSEQADLEDFL